MQNNTGKTLAKFLEYIPIWIVLKLGYLMPHRMRGAFFARIGGFLASTVPGGRRRIMAGLHRVFPDMSDRDVRILCKKIGQNFGRTISEILFNARFKKHSELFDAQGPGLAALQAAKSNGKGAIIVSAHFGQWEAIRHYLKSLDMETGAVYRKNSNPWYEQDFLAGIEQGGAPIVAKSSSGNVRMVKHLRRGGFFALLVDQKFQSGHLLPFLGHDALTPTAAAELALRYDLPLVPAFGTRDENGLNIHIEFEPEIEHTDAISMTQEVNDRISARILAHPEQWYWLHKRWDDIHLHEEHNGDKAKKT